MPATEPDPTSITEIDQAIKDAIKNSELKKFVRTVGGYDDFIEAVSEDGEEVGNFPGVFITYVGGQLERQANGKHLNKTVWRVFVVNQDFRQEDRRTEPESGTYALVTAILILLKDNDFGIKALQFGLRPTGVENVSNPELLKRSISAYAIDFHTQHLIDSREEDFVRALKVLAGKYILQNPVSGNDSDYESETTFPT